MLEQINVPSWTSWYLWKVCLMIKKFWDKRESVVSLKLTSLDQEVRNIWSRMEHCCNVLFCWRSWEDGRGKRNQWQIRQAKAIGVTLLKLCNCTLLRSIHNLNIVLLASLLRLSQNMNLFWPPHEFSHTWHRHVKGKENLNWIHFFTPEHLTIHFLTVLRGSAH